MAQINDKFKQKRPNVTINFETLGQGPTWTQAQTARISGQTADVTATYGFAPQDIINFQPDSQFLDLSALSSIKTFDQPNVPLRGSLEGQGLEMTLAYVGHRLDQRGHVGQVRPQAPTTYAELQTMSDKLSRTKETPIFYAAKPRRRSTAHEPDRAHRWSAQHPNFWSDLLVQGKADFTTAEWIESFRRAKEFTSKYFDPAFSGIDYPTGAGLFATGKYAMWPEGSFSGGDIMAAKPAFQKLGAFNAPWSDDADANAVQPVYGDIGWAGLRDTKNRTSFSSGSTSSGRKRTSRASCKFSSTTRRRPSSSPGRCPKQRRRCSRKRPSQRRAWSCRA
jgi:raffinose/stachyose/melibiose transport system substrate-binding protein